jgi:alpha-tubulin suppressor-like RCC1 family protein
VQDGADGGVWRPSRLEAIEDVSVASVHAGREHSLALGWDGRLFGWGAARYGRLGIGAVEGLPRDRQGETYVPEPRLLHALSSSQRVVCAAAGACHSLAVCSPRDAQGAPQRGGSVFAWGLGSAGRLGRHLSRDDQASERDDHDAAIQYDELDEEPYAPEPAPLAALAHVSVTAIAAGSAHSLALAADGGVYGWGLASHGRLGVGLEEELPADEDHDTFAAEPRRLRGLNGFDVAQISAGDAHTLARSRTGQLFCWGMAANGRLGFAEGALTLPREHDGDAYQPVPRQVWLEHSGDASALLAPLPLSPPSKHEPPGSQQFV